jgi:excisionase family DNA binding protein
MEQERTREPSAGLPDLMTVHDVAAAYKVSEMTVRRWLVAGKLPGSKQPGGHAWIILRADVERMLRGAA